MRDVLSCVSDILSSGYICRHENPFTCAAFIARTIGFAQPSFGIRSASFAVQMFPSQGLLKTSHIDTEKALRLHKLAVERAAKKQFGQRMIDKHTKANQQVKQLAEQEGVDLPHGMTALTGQQRER